MEDLLIVKSQIEKIVKEHVKAGENPVTVKMHQDHIDVHFNGIDAEVRDAITNEIDAWKAGEQHKITVVYTQ